MFRLPLEASHKNNPDSWGDDVTGLYSGDVPQNNSPKLRAEIRLACHLSLACS